MVHLGLERERIYLFVDLVNELYGFLRDHDWRGSVYEQCV